MKIEKEKIPSIIINVLTAIIFITIVIVGYNTMKKEGNTNNTIKQNTYNSNTNQGYNEGEYKTD